MSAGDSLPVRAVARATGIPAATLRVWERRYGRPKPARTPAGQRRFAAADVAFLRQVAEGLRVGHRPAELLSATPAQLAQLLRRGRPAPGGASAWMRAALELDGAGLGRLCLERAQSLPLAAFLDGHAGPFLAELGTAWAEGRADIHHEHCAVEVLKGVLATLAAERAREPRGAPVVLATLSGELHALGLAMLGAVLAEAGVPRLALGPDLPAEEIVQAARQVGARRVAVSVSLAHAGLATDRALSELARALQPGAELFAGGGGARPPRRGRAYRVFTDLASFSRLLAGALDEPSRRKGRP